MKHQEYLKFLGLLIHQKVVSSSHELLTCAMEFDIPGCPDAQHSAQSKGAHTQGTIFFFFTVLVHCEMRSMEGEIVFAVGILFFDTNTRSRQVSHRRE